VEIRWMGGQERRFDSKNFSEKNRTAVAARRQLWWQRSPAASPSGDGLRQSGMVSFFDLDAALEGPLFHGDVGCKSRPRKRGTFRFVALFLAGLSRSGEFLKKLWSHIGIDCRAVRLRLRPSVTAFTL